MMPAHPRVGGEDAWSFSTDAGNEGSPPRRRGRPDSSRGHRGCESAHPRVGGEDANATPDAVDLSGSPPRRRGRRPQSTALVVRPKRFIGVPATPSPGPRRQVYFVEGGDPAPLWNRVPVVYRRLPPRRLRVAARGRLSLRSLRTAITAAARLTTAVANCNAWITRSAMLTSGSPPRRRGRLTQHYRSLFTGRLTPA